MVCLQGKAGFFISMPLTHVHGVTVWTRLVADTAWHPVMTSDYKAAPDSVKTGLQLGMGPFRFLASIGHW